MLALVLALAALVGAPELALEQQPPARGDSVPLRADYRDLAELVQKLPNVAAPALDETRALWLEALPLSCLDRLQPIPGAGRARGGRGGPGRGEAAATVATLAGSPADTGPHTARLDSAQDLPNDSAGRARNTGRGSRGAARPAAAPNNGAGYFWVANYTLLPDHDRLRAFWGCSDWHSAVSSTWATVRLLKRFPASPLRQLASEKLDAHLGRSNLNGELTFFQAAAAAINPIPSANQQGLFERPYGFAWLLELSAELRTWPDTQADRWSADVTPLATWMADSLAGYMNTLVVPVRTGAQTNTAQSMTLALDYAGAIGDASRGEAASRLRSAILGAARRFYLSDSTCATELERIPPAPAVASGEGRRGARGPGRGRGADSTPHTTTPNDLTALGARGRGAAAPAAGFGGPVVVSPCLSEAALMGRVLEPHPYAAWLDHFLPPLQSGRFAPLTEAIDIPASAPPQAPRGGGAAGPDTSGAARAAAIATERARLAGLSFSRAQDMERIARELPATDARVAVLHRLAAIQADRGFELMHDDTAGISWLPAQALLYEAVRK